ncbi:hypothetical protein DAMA08_022710 [Martiniozyma asiatica (nom. inval.)]|nr:hypothetical protein DAMA08_022710 [Martiniozyma asiatica]
MSSLLEKSLDEIIGTKPASARRPNRASKNPRRGGSRVSKSNYNRQQQHRRGNRKNFSAINGSSTLLKVSNLHPELTSQDIQSLFDQVGPTVSVDLKYDSHGIFTGLAMVEYENANDANEAINKFDRRLAAGRVINVDSTVPLADRIGIATNSAKGKRNNNSNSNNNNKQRERKPKPQKKSADDLDKELEMYMGNEGQAPQGETVMTEDLSSAIPVDNAETQTAESGVEQPAAIELAAEQVINNSNDVIM